jgi:hypothetical protein
MKKLRGREGEREEIDQEKRNFFQRDKRGREKKRTCFLIKLGILVF